MTRNKIIKPKGISVKAIKKAIDDALLDQIAEAEKLFYQSYLNWKDENKPTFKTVGPRTNNGSRRVEYSTISVPYTYVANGTPGPYTIRPQHAGGFLRFKAGSIPKTAPGTLLSTGGAPGTTWVTLPEVTHPGIEAREFQVIVCEELQNELPGAMQERLNEALG